MRTLFRVLVASAVASLMLPPVLRAQDARSAKALFEAPPGSFSNPRGPVGIKYWFADGAGNRFARANDAGTGARLSLYVRTNTSGFLSAFLVEGAGGGEMLTPLEGGYPGDLIDGALDHAVPGVITVPPRRGMTRILLLFARSQTEQVGTAAQAQEKIQRLSALPARDGGPRIVYETQAAPSTEIGTYVVHREGAQPGAEIDLGG